MYCHFYLVYFKVANKNFKNIGFKLAFFKIFLLENKSFNKIV